MRSYSTLAIYCLMALSLSSCEFSCSVGGDKEPEGSSSVKNGAKIYNDIKVNSFKAKLTRAYLVFEDGTRVPDDNFVDFSQPVKLILDTDGGWVVEDKKVFLGVSEKIIDENGQVILDAQDLFSAYEDGVPASDAKRLTIKASLKLPANAPPQSFSVQFRVWDKKGDGFIEGSYMLFSK